MSVERAQKPVDRWLTSVAVMLTILLWGLPKTTTIVISLLSLIFLLAIHPIWNFWWIEEKLWRRLTSLAVLTVALCITGIEMIPYIDLKIDLQGIMLIHAVDPTQCAIQMTVSAKNDGSLSTYASDISLSEEIAGNEIKGRYLVGEKPPAVSVALPELETQELAPGKPVHGLVYFAFAVPFASQYKAMCEAGDSPRGRFIFSFKDSNNKVWTATETFAKLYSETSCVIAPSK